MAIGFLGLEFARLRAGFKFRLSVVAPIVVVLDEYVLLIYGFSKKA